jgi:hypothetical protein
MGMAPVPAHAEGVVVAFEVGGGGAVRRKTVRVPDPRESTGCGEENEGTVPFRVSR